MDLPKKERSRPWRPTTTKAAKFTVTHRPELMVDKLTVKAACDDAQNLASALTSPANVQGRGQPISTRRTHTRQQESVL